MTFRSSGTAMWLTLPKPRSDPSTHVGTCNARARTSPRIGSPPARFWRRSPAVQRPHCGTWPERIIIDGRTTSRAYCVTMRARRNRRAALASSGHGRTLQPARRLAEYAVEVESGWTSGNSPPATENSSASAPHVLVFLELSVVRVRRRAEQSNYVQLCR